MNRVLWCLAVPMCLAMAVGEAAARDRARFEVEVGAARIDGPGEGLLSIKDKAVRGIDDGDRQHIALRWNATEHWYVKGTYARTTVRYANPLDPACPLSASAVGRGAFGFGQLCQIEVADRLEGQLDEKLLAHEFMIGHRAPLSERWSVDAAIGVGRLRWESQDDIEAYDTSRCREELDRIVPRPQPPVAGCQQIQPRARETGAVALLSLAYSPTPRISLRADGHFQDYRHLIWRSDVVNRFREANCRENRCRAASLIARGRFAELEQGSWHWYSAALDYSLTEHWHAVLRYETGGNRDWDIASLSVRYVW